MASKTVWRHPGTLADPRVIEWVRAQGVDPATVSVGDNRIERDDSGVLRWTFHEFVLDENGKRTLCGACFPRRRWFNRDPGHYTQRLAMRIVHTLPH